MLVEGAALLVDHDAVLAQGVVADAVELAGEVALGGAEGVRGVHDDQVVLLLAAADEAQGVVVEDVDAAVVETGGVLGQVGPAGLDDLGVHLHQVDPLDALVAGQLLDHAAVAGADDQHVLDAGMDRHRNVGDHLVVDELVALRELDVAVQGQHPPEFGGLEDVDALVVGLLGVQMLVDPDRMLHVGGVKFAEPEFHGITSQVYCRDKRCLSASFEQGSFSL